MRGYLIALIGSLGVCNSTFGVQSATAGHVSADRTPDIIMYDTTLPNATLILSGDKVPNGLVVVPFATGGAIDFAFADMDGDEVC